VVVQVEPPKPAPVPAPVAPAVPVPAPVVPPVPAASEGNLLYLSGWFSLSPLGGETDSYLRNQGYYNGSYYNTYQYSNANNDAGETKPPVGIGLELDFRPHKNFGLKASLMGTSMAQSRKVYIPSGQYGGMDDEHYKRADYGMVFTIAPEYLFKWFDREFGIFFGLASYTHSWEDSNIPDFKDTSIGIYTGMEGEIYKLGPGSIFATLNTSFLFGTSKEVPEIPTPGIGNWNPNGRLQAAFALNIGIGYRFGFIARKSK
jgi:hypothetical protein